MISKDSVARFSQFTPEKFKTILRKSQFQFREKLRKLRRRQKSSFLLYKKRAVKLMPVCFSAFVIWFTHAFLGRSYHT